MGIFTKSQTEASEYAYAEIYDYLSEKDGNVHVIMINSFSKFLNQSLGCETKYTTQIDTILSLMQKDGYEIIDVKFNSIQDQGLTKAMEGFHTLVTYR